MNAAAIRSRPWLAAGGAGALLLTLVLWCTRTPEVAVDAAVAHRGALRVEVSTNGTVEPVPDAELRVHARTDGRIVRIPEPGTPRPGMGLDGMHERARLVGGALSVARRPEGGTEVRLDVPIPVRA